MIKYASNLFLATKISFFNEIHMISRDLGIDSKILGEAVALDKRIGGMVLLVDSLSVVCVSPRIWQRSYRLLDP